MQLSFLRLIYLTCSLPPFLFLLPGVGLIHMLIDRVTLKSEYVNKGIDLIHKNYTIII